MYFPDWGCVRTLLTLYVYATAVIFGVLHFSRRCCVCVSGDGRGAAKIINRWVADKTANKITKLLAPDSVDSSTRLVLVNAVYFKGDWLEKFNARFTKNEDFHVSSHETVKAKLMRKEYESIAHGWNHELECEAIELPYSGKKLSMFVLLPDQGSSLSQLEDKLTAADLVDVAERFSMWGEEVTVWLPRFKLDEKLSLAEMLRAMGMRDLFTPGAADLSGVDGSKGLSVSKVMHQAVVDVNEDGTEATAALEEAAEKGIPEENFRADRPFLFFIQHKATKSILFLGRLVRPASDAK